jgi:hypothetical protein
MRKPLIVSVLLALSLLVLSCSTIVGNDTSSESSSAASSSLASSSSSSAATGTSSAITGALGTTAITVTTATYNGHYSPKNVLACWVADASGQRVRTLRLYAGERIGYLTLWKAAGGTTLDGVTGATRSGHGTLAFTWDGTNEDGVALGAGSYTFQVQMTEADNSGKTLAIAAELGSSPVSKSSTGAGFTAFAIDYTP